MAAATSGLQNDFPSPTYRTPADARGGRRREPRANGRSRRAGHLRSESVRARQSEVGVPDGLLRRE